MHKKPQKDTIFPSNNSKLPIIFVVVIAIVGIIAWYLKSRPATVPPPVISQPSAQPATPSSPFQETIPNKQTAPSEAPEGMVWIPGGEYSMGAADPRGMNHGGPDAMDDARPIHRVYVDGFWMDKTEVTNEEYAQFVKATGYKTVA
ncbi:formylglycine-generating enzyme family protein, partial [bacterium]|nr:formylglycine-generating enzyme family protein [bacterium]